MTRVRRASIIFDQSPSRIVGRCADSASPGPRQHAEGPPPDTENPTAPQPAPQPDAGQAIAELREVLESISTAVSDAEEARRRSLDELQQLAIEVSTAIAGELVFRSIDANEHNVGALVSAAVRQLGLDSALSIALHPADVELVESLTKSTEAEQEWHSEDITLRSDIDCPRGHCRASNGTTTLLSEITPRMEEIRRLLWEGLDDAQIERRQAAQHDSPLKRFPDRRETA